ncbi:hypothetical protein BDP27DRAFT_1366928 [Rhodocollybia butyracea]|uniref:Protein kinase domain-containing protein n=1 Tax=Rhodocollybia butyracea TaxID=206335 RepID=A0A9P5PKB7_9AGAR|nr:hypothetical protein BDP27DRAFT_1366928 [Rhodocollybia butyracea]
MYPSIHVLLIIHALSIFIPASYAAPIPHSLSHEQTDAWIGDDYGSDSNLNTNDKQAFVQTLEGVELGGRLSGNGGGYNAGIYVLSKDYKGHEASQVIAKCMQTPIDVKAWGEVKALKTVGYFIDSGLLLKDNARIPVILMKRIPGVVPPLTRRWKSEKERAKLLEEIKPKVKAEIVGWAVRNKMLLTDFHPGNIHVDLTEEDTVKSVNVLDFGYPGVYVVKPTVKEDEVGKWFEEQWSELVEGFQLPSTQGATEKKIPHQGSGKNSQPLRWTLPSST